MRSTKLPWVCVCLFHFAFSVAAEPTLQVHPDNPRYFQYLGQPALVITSGEHYGAVLNRPFDYRVYLNTLAESGLNGTRIFSGAYCEPPGAFKIGNNTLAPRPGDLICPWARSGESGYAGGGNKFDLTQWDPAYFERLEAFMTLAAEKGVIVEYVFFCPFYKESMWALSPMNADNNVNGIGAVESARAYSMASEAALLEVQEALVRKVVTELNRFDNLYFEVCNEPYIKNLPMDWHDRMAEVIHLTERDLSKQHLVSWNVANKKAEIKDPSPAYAIFNFHYATPPETVFLNAHLNLPLGDNETGFKGQENRPYRTEAWEFILAGGALFNHLDYSFAVGFENGAHVYTPDTPGGGNATLRQQLAWLAKLMKRFDFVRMEPLSAPTGKPRVYGLVDGGGQSLRYFAEGLGGAYAVSLPEGDYIVEWHDPKACRLIRREEMTAPAEGNLPLSPPKVEEDLALAIFRK